VLLRDNHKNAYYLITNSNILIINQDNNLCKLFINLILITTVFSTYSFAQNGWQQVSTVPSGFMMASIYFVNDSIGFAAGGSVARTTNAGNNWISSIVNPRQISVYFVNTSTGWTCGILGSIRKTTNGGVNWFNQVSSVPDVLNTVFFINENTGWIAGGDFSSEVILRTTNGGTNWILSGTGSSGKMFAVHFLNENTGWAVGSASSQKIYKSTNGGVNWFSQTSGSLPALYSVCFINGSTGWAAGTNSQGAIIKTTNGGVNWVQQVGNLFGSGTGVFQIFFMNDTLGWAAGGNGSNSGGIFGTTNGGLNWYMQAVPSNPHVPSVHFRNPALGWAISGNGAVFRTTTGGFTFVEKVGSNVPSEFKLYQNYPNPFNPVTIINYELRISSYVILAVFDVLGKIVETFVNQKQSPGKYEVVFSGAGLPSGVYFSKLISEGYSETRKMVLLK